MRATFVLRIFWFFVVVLSIQLVRGQYAGTHTSLSRWCGKPYQTGSPNYNPGGQTYPPLESTGPLLHLQIQPRYNIYVSSESQGSFLVDAPISNTHGVPFRSISGDGYLTLDIIAESSNRILVKNHRIAVNSTRNELTFSLNQLQPQKKGYTIKVNAVYGREAYSSSTELFYLPDKTEGSVTKLDALYGGMLFKNKASNYTFEPLLGVGFYTNYGGYLAQNKQNIHTYYDSGFRTMHAIATYDQPTSPPYNPLDLSQVWDEADKLNLLWVYDMRGVFQNTTQVALEATEHKDRETLYMWYTADEPDGQENSLNSTKHAYDTIRSIDLYHPIGLVLNCENFYFEQYTSGADIIMEDAYPIAINATFSYNWGIPCNSTYGDCGCDNCIGIVQDVSNRLDTLTSYQSFLGQQQKPKYAVPQAFSDDEYWPRLPRTNEVWAMNGLAFNHGAKSLQIWTFPTNESLVAAHAQYAGVVTIPPILTYLIGGNPVPILVPNMPKLDIAFWTQGRQHLISFVNGYNRTVERTIKIKLPFSASTIDSQPFGQMDWSLAAGNILQVDGSEPLEHSMIILSL